MNNTVRSDIEPSAISWTKSYCKEYGPQIDYFLKFGNPLEQAMFKQVVELAGVTV